MTRAEIYRRAAEKSLLTGNGLDFLHDHHRDLFEAYYTMSPDFGRINRPDEFSTALCFAAAMAEAGDL